MGGTLIPNIHGCSCFGLLPTVMRSELGVGHSLEHPLCCCLPRAAGSAPDSEPPEALASMSDERFAEIFQELQARGDKAKLRQLFGA
jgi:hypothetical protein